MSFKTLYVLRHAKAEAGAFNQDDKSRSLSAQGYAQAEALGVYLQSRAIKPALTLCSSARRTRETLAGVEKSTGALAVEFSDALYHASAESMLALIRTTPDAVSSLMLVGHNPGMHQLALLLAGEESEAPAMEEAALHYPPCSLAVYTLQADRWGELTAYCAKLERFLTPEAIANEEMSAVI